MKLMIFWEVKTKYTHIVNIIGMWKEEGREEGKERGKTERAQYWLWLISKSKNYSWEVREKNKYQSRN